MGGRTLAVVRESEFGGSPISEVMGGYVRVRLTYGGGGPPTSSLLVDVLGLLGFPRNMVMYTSILF